ncbi:unnamed protein product, partial [Mesorhabditis belari]|uniref:2-aminoethanethiol dioxygenase n=1 Tax=Mesorhabditis belari TaxID=2138241 RepID=A0AAF3EMG2_9BILA
MDRQALRALLIPIQEMCNKFAQQRITRSTIFSYKREIEELVNQVNYKNLRMNRPSSLEWQDTGAPTHFAEIHFSENLQIGAFGLTNIGCKVPLHDHPLIHGFIKVIYGKIEIHSFSTKTHLAPEDDGTIEALYEGSRILTPEDNAIYLSPGNGNLHEIVCMDPASVFFDVLIPGYQDCQCSYYEMPRPLPPPQTVAVVKRRPRGGDYWTAAFDYPRLFDL